jgi:uncharacterized protein YkwD
MLTPRYAAHHERARLGPIGAAIILAITLAVGVGARPAAAGTAETMESSIVSWINSARAARGVPALATRAALSDLAGRRAASLAAAGVLSHDVAGCLSCQLNARGIVWHADGEAIGGTSYPWGMDAARSLWNALSKSSEHMAILMSRTYDQVGAGVAYRSANGNTYLSIVVIDGDPIAGRPPSGGSATRSSSLPTRLVRLAPAVPLVGDRGSELWLMGAEPDIGAGSTVWRWTLVLC